jgi:hypothetical protein
VRRLGNRQGHRPSGVGYESVEIARDLDLLIAVVLAIAGLGGLLLVPNLVLGPDPGRLPRDCGICRGPNRTLRPFAVNADRESQAAPALPSLP